MAAMTRDEAVSFIQVELGFRTDQTDNIIARLKQAQRLFELGRSLPWFLVQEDATLTATTGSGEIALPTGFIREVPHETLRYYSSTDTEEVFLEKLSLVEAVSRFTDVDAGAPLAYVLRKSTVAIYPERDTSYALTWSYYKQADELSTNITNAWLTNAPDALIGRAGMLIAEVLKNQSALVKFTSLYREGWAAAFAQTIMREEDNDPLYVGGQL